MFHNDIMYAVMREHARELREEADAHQVRRPRERQAERQEQSTRELARRSRRHRPATGS